MSVFRTSNIRLWTYLSAGLLLILANAKLMQIMTDDRLGESFDPVFPFLSLRLSHLAAAVLEIGCALLCLVSKDSRVVGSALVVLGTVFLSYRLTFSALGLRTGCGCLGVLEKTFGLDQNSSLVLTLGITLYLLIVGISCILAFSAPVRR